MVQHFIQEGPEESVNFSVKKINKVIPQYFV